MFLVTVDLNVKISVVKLKMKNWPRPWLAFMERTTHAVFPSSLRNKTVGRKLRDTFIFAWLIKPIPLSDGHVSSNSTTNLVPKVSLLTCPRERVCCTTWLTWQHQKAAKTQEQLKWISNFSLLIRLMRLTSVAWQTCCYDLSVNWDETQASPHFKLVNTNFNAFVHCSSELNWILK